MSENSNMLEKSDMAQSRTLRRTQVGHRVFTRWYRPADRPTDRATDIPTDGPTDTWRTSSVHTMVTSVGPSAGQPHRVNTFPDRRRTVRRTSSVHTMVPSIGLSDGQ